MVASFRGLGEVQRRADNGEQLPVGHRPVRPSRHGASKVVPDEAADVLLKAEAFRLGQAGEFAVVPAGDPELDSDGLFAGGFGRATNGATLLANLSTFHSGSPFA